MKTTHYLDAAKKKLGIESDYALAPHLGLTKQAISKLRHRPLVMGNTTAARVAAILGVDPMKVIADCELERGTNDELWRRIARRVAAVLLAIGAATIGALPSPAQASPGAGFNISCSNTHCAAIRRRRAPWRALLELLRALTGAPLPFAAAPRR